MKIISNIKNTISIPFIVISVCLFNVNTSIALPRPFLPITGKWPGVNGSLNSIITKVQEHKEENKVIWVDYDSPYFSHDEFVPNKAAESFTVFKGFQDVDKPSADFDSFEPISAPVKNKKKNKDASHVKQEQDESQQVTQSEQVIVQSVNNKIRDFRAIDEPLFVQTETYVEKSSLWSNLDS
jgi:hypothetical protein